MSSCYSANQYDSAFRSQRLQNWCETKRFKERPTAKRGPITIIANDRGHLLPGVARSGSAWPDFKGTWDLPARIPVHHINPTARSAEGLKRLKSWGVDPQCTETKSLTRSCSKNSERLQDVGQQTSADILQDCSAPSAAEARPASQSRPITGGERTADQNHDLQGTAAGSEEDNQATPATGADGPSGHCSVAGEKPLSSVSEKATPSSSRQRVGKTEKQ